MAPMTKLDPTKTLRYRNLRSGRPEIWEATSADGQWCYAREEEPGTPWHVLHIPSGEVRFTYLPTLGYARKVTAQ